MSTKNNVLALLEGRRSEYISGQELADSLKVTRTSVWKAVRALEEEGHHIDAVSNKGYRLTSDSDILSREGILAGRVSNIHAPVLVLKTVDSTNTYAKMLAIEGTAHGTLVVSEEQSAGRGRYGKSFFSPKGTGLYMSIVLRPGSDTAAAQMVTVAAAVSVCEAIEELTGQTPGIKWVNDIFLDSKKICGILSEAGTDFETGAIDYIIVGIGINCTTLTEAFPEDIRSIAGSIGGAGLIRNALCTRIYDKLMGYFGHLNEGGLVNAYRNRSIMQGKRVSFISAGAARGGVAQSINDAGNLVVLCDDGELLTLVGGEVSLGSEYF